MALTAATCDAAGQDWASTTALVADESGEVDLRRDAPGGGDCSGVDPTGPIWSMCFVHPDVAPSAFVSPADQLTITFSAKADGEQAAVEIIRRWSTPGVTSGTIAGERFLGGGTGAAGLATGDPSRGRS